MKSCNDGTIGLSKKILFTLGFNPQATEWGHLWPQSYYLMCQIFIFLSEFFSYHEFVGLLILHSFIVFCGDQAICMA